MERGIGQHQPQGSHARCDIWGQGLARAAAQEHDGPAAGLQQVCLGRSDDAKLVRRFQVRHQQRKRFGLALLALAQSADRLGIQGIAGQVITAQTLDGNHLPLQQLARHQ